MSGKHLCLGDLTNIPTSRYVALMDQRTPRVSGDSTRQRILNAAFDEFYENGFQGGSLSRIVAAAGATKGALFHHFAGKQALGYADLDEVIAPQLRERWLTPLLGSLDPVRDLKRMFDSRVREDLESGAWLKGCPLNNLAQEMSHLDKGFHSRINGLYGGWRRAWEEALMEGKARGVVRTDLNPEAVAALLVAGQMGIWGTGKSSRNRAVMIQAANAISSYLDLLAS